MWIRVLSCIYRVGKKIKILVTILVVWQLLSNFCLIRPMLCNSAIEEKDLLLLYFKIVPQRQSRESFCTSSCGTQSDRGHKLCQGVSHSRLCDQKVQKCKGVNKRTGSGRMTVVDYDSLRDAIREIIGTSTDNIINRSSYIQNN